MRGLIWALAVVGSVLVVSSVGTWTQVRAYCQPGQAAQLQFGFGFAALKDRLGPEMGEPIECARTHPESGDVLQRTTTGLAFQRKGIGPPMFTRGHDVWTLTPEGMAPLAR